MPASAWAFMSGHGGQRQPLAARHWRTARPVRPAQGRPDTGLAGPGEEGVDMAAPPRRPPRCPPAGYERDPTPALSTRSRRARSALRPPRLPALPADGRAVGDPRLRLARAPDVGPRCPGSPPPPGPRLPNRGDRPALQSIDAGSMPSVGMTTAWWSWMDRGQRPGAHGCRTGIQRTLAGTS
jgi:hypothetical protein